VSAPVANIDTPRPRHGRLWRFVPQCIVVLIFAGLYGYFVLTQDGFDWDQFYSMMYVDLSIWVNEHTIPDWSYQFCGGSSRIADPQAYSASPLFLAVVAFGPVWGLKFLCMLLFVSTFAFTRRSLAYVYALNRPRVTISWACSFFLTAIAVMVAASGYFLWQLVSGAFTQLLNGLAAGLIYYSLVALTRRLTRREIVAMIGIGWVYYSAGIFHSFVYFTLPVLLGLGIGAVGNLLYRALVRRGASEALWAIGRLCCVNGLAILPGLYKLVPVALYQSGHARGAGEQWDHGLTLLRLILLQLIPTYGPRFLFLDSWIQINGVHPYLIWASGAFSPVGWILLLVAPLTLLRLRHVRLTLAESRHNAPPPVGWLLLCASITCVLLALGNFSEYAPYTLFNTLLFQNSLHICDRFVFAIMFCLAMLLAWCLAVSRLTSRVLLMSLALGGLTASAWNFRSFYHFYPASSFFDTRSVENGVADMAALFSYPHADPHRSKEIREMTVIVPYAWPPHFPILIQGKGILNCYQPMAHREALFQVISSAEEVLGKTQDDKATTSFPIVVPTEAVPTSCQEGTFVTQRRVHLDPSCPGGTCLYIDAVNPNDPVRERLEFRDGYFCLK